MTGIGYTPDQIAAIEANSNLVITACPGSGKTSVIVEKIRRQVESLQDYKGVVGITFTVKASKELRSRCGRDGLNTKLSFFGTIDHFCLSEIIYPFISRIFGATRCVLECKMFKDVDDDMQAKLPNLSEVGNELKSDHFIIYQSVFKELYDRGIILLESVAILALEILKNSRACQNYISSRYVSVFVDEYQDSSEPQHRLFLELLKLGLYGVAVGDVQQSIYAWRGSDPKYILELIESPDVFEHHLININHRCHPSINNYANRIISDDCQIVETQELRVYQWFLNGDQYSVAEQLDSSVKKLLSDGLVSTLSDVAVLVRWNKSLEYLKAKLSVPFRIYSDDILSSINSSVTKFMGVLLYFHFDKEILVGEVLDTISGFNALSQSEKSKYRYLVRDIRTCSPDKLLNLILKLVGMAFGDSLKDSEIKALGEVLEDPDTLKNYHPKDPNELQVMTLHKAKGLEFDVVYHLDLYDWVFPKREYTGNFNEEVFPDWQQDLNLHFVGITRAKEHCILISSNRRINSNGESKSGSKSQFMTLSGITGLHR